MQQLEPLRQLALDLLRQEYVKENSTLFVSLSKFLTTVEQSLNYHYAIQSTKEKGLMAAIGTMVSDSRYRSLLISQTPEIIQRRVLHYLGKTKDI